MSDKFTKVPNEVLDDNTTTVPARFLYALLLSHAWSKNEAFPGQKNLAERMGLSEKSVRKYINELVEQGYLTRKRRGLNHTNLYTLNKWISSDYERENLPVKRKKRSTIKKHSQLPTKYTQKINTQSDYTKSESVNTQPTKIKKGSQSYFEIVEACEPNLAGVSHITLVDEGDILTVLKKMASYYAAKNMVVEDWTAMLVHWVMKDREAGKVEVSRLVMSEVRDKELRKRISVTVASIFADDWNRIDGLTERMNSFLLSRQKLETPLDEIKNFLEELKVEYPQNLKQESAIDDK